MLEAELPGAAWQNPLVQRINVIGSSGSGKTTLAERLAARLGLPHLELDSIHHLPDWEPVDIDVFRAEVAGFAAQEAWVIDGNYSKVRDLVWSRADTVIFLDFPRWRVMSRLVPRTLRRIVTRQELWNGNRERMRDLFSRVPEQNLLLWSWSRHHMQVDRFEAAVSDPGWAHIRFIRLRTPREVRELVDPGLSVLDGDSHHC